MSRFIHPKFNALSPYTPGEQPRGRSYVKLNTNECPYPPAPGVIQAACEEAGRLNLYSDPTCKQAVDALAAAYGVQPDEVFVGNGSDEVLTLIFAALCPNGVAYADVTYSFYPVLADLCALPVAVVPLRESFALVPEDYVQLGRTIVIANPNAPTGMVLPVSDIEKILRWNPENLVVVDEAYVDFGAESAVSLIKRYDNLMVVGTFSKSRAMAGARFGYAVANRALIADLGRIKYSFNPYNVNRMTLAAAAAALADTEYFDTCRGKIINTRARSLQTLRDMGFDATESMANFVFISHPTMPAETIFYRLREAGILVRWWNKPRISNHLRVTIGTDEEMDALFAALQKILANE